jgi:putative transposase
MTMTGDQKAHPLGADDSSAVQAPTARDAVYRMVEAGLLDQLMSQVDAGELTLTGDGGFLPEMIKAVLERGLAAEQTAHLGYEKGDPAGRPTPNSRNGSTPKPLATEVGDIALDVPRDRAGTFEPRLVPKGSRRTGGLDEMIISLYAGRDDRARHRPPPGPDAGHRAVPQTPSPRSPTRCSRRSRPGSPGRWRRSIRSST